MLLENKYTVIYGTGDSGRHGAGGDASAAHRNVPHVHIRQTLER
jgi:hypothetical protein